MDKATRRRWYVEDGIAAQRLHGLDDTAEAIRLDRPRWRDLARFGDPVEGIVVGDGRRHLDLAAALADLARHDRAVLVVPSAGLTDTTWVEACASWHLAATPQVDDGVTRLELAPAGDGPQLATITALHNRTRRPPARLPAPWRTALLDGPARAWFADVPEAPRDRAALTVASTSYGDEPTDRDDAGPRRLRIADGRARQPDPDTVVVTDDPALADEGVRVVARPVDLGRYSPAGSRPRAATGAPILPISPDGHPDDVSAARALAREVADRVHTLLPDVGADVGEVALPADGLPTPPQVRDLRTAVGVLDHPGVHASPAAHARWLLACIAAGVPVLPLAPPPPAVADLVGGAVVDTLTAVTAEVLTDPDLRDRASVLQRRQVLTCHTASTRLAELADDLGLLAPAARTVSIVMATNRRELIEFACGQIARQDWPRLEVVIVSHGDDAPAVTRRVVDEHLGALPTTVLNVADRWTLGDALNVGIEHAGGDIVTKFDDDDWYSPSHVTDLVLALDHSGADLVGKGAEFVHLAQSTTTLRRWGQGGESNSTTLAGGTLTMPRDVWRDVSGFPRVNVGEDRGLIDDVLAAGGIVYRTHPFGYLLHRHGNHAWSVPDQDFLDSAVAVRDGLDHDWTLT